ncbi:MAG: hypothetical protein PHH37_08590 [Paludibacter sp.]|nr:hypothetical protein [Paludibacter sp.]
MHKILTYSFLSALFLFSCKSTEKSSRSSDSNINFAVAQTVIYKTIGDYNDLVPVTMNTEKTKIVSYPAPLDLTYEGKLSKPTKLKNGYLLDNRGISVNTVFLKYTYEEYSKMNEAPTLENMMKNIAEKHPFSAMYHCGPRTKYQENTVKKLNELIDTGFADCSKENIIPFQIEF